MAYIQDTYYLGDYIATEIKFIGRNGAKGEPVKHADKWQKTLILLNGTRFYIYTNQHHEYSNWLKSHCEKKGPK